MHRREIEVSFSQRIKEVEDRFSGDQETIAERFQADVLKLEQHYQSELKALSESHIEQKLHWEAQLQTALEGAEEQRRMMEETMEQERENLNQQWTEKQHELENIHKEELVELRTKNKQLQNELDDFISTAQTKEIELSKQLNDLHNRLQESLQTKDELLAQCENRALQAELLLNQTVEDFKQERAEHLSSQSEIEAKYIEVQVLSERQIMERIELLTERDDLKMKIEELETLLKQAAVDFELERKELQEHISSVEEKLKDDLENDREELIAERDLLLERIKELEGELSQVLASIENAEKKETEESDDFNASTEEEEEQNNKECVSLSGEEEETSSAPEIGDCVLAESPENVDHECDQESPASNDDDEGDGKEQDEQTAETDNNTEDAGDVGEGCENDAGAVSETGGSFPEDTEKEGDPHVSCCSPETGPCDEESNLKDVENKNESVSSELPCEAVSSLEVFEGVDADEDAADCENKVVLESCEEKIKPQAVPTHDSTGLSHEEEPCHETVVDPSVLEETRDPGEVALEDIEVNCLSNNSHHHKEETELVSDPDCEHLTTKLKDELDVCEQDCTILKLQALYNTATEENVLLHEKISLLQQKTEILENLLAHNSEKIKTGHEVLEENYSLKVRMILLMEHIRDLEIKALKMTDLQIRYEDCLCENAKLKDQNSELEKRLWSLESRMDVFSDFKDQQISLVDEISRMREENTKLSELFGELERQDEILSAIRPESESPAEDFEDLTTQLQLTAQAVSELEDCCEEFEKQNNQLRQAVTELQDKSQTLNQTTQANR